MKIKVSAIACIGVLFLTGCIKDKEYNPRRPELFRSKVFFSMVSSSVILSEREPKEKTGTNIRIDTEEEIKKESNYWMWSRMPLKTDVKGWNKNLLWIHLENKTALKIKLDENFLPLEFFGYDTIHSQTVKVKQSENLTRRVVDALDTITLKNIHTDRWKLFTFMKPGTYVPDQIIDKSQIAEQVKTIHIDSIKTLPFRKRNRQDCFEYSVFYHRIGNLQFDMEQFFEIHKKELDYLQIGTREYYTASPKYGKIIKPELWANDSISGRWSFGVELNTGSPCYESKFEYSIQTIVDSFSNNRIKFQLNNYYEKIYKTL